MWQPFSAENFLFLGLLLVLERQQVNPNSQVAVFRSYYGVSPAICQELWELLGYAIGLDANVQPKHLLWALSFMKKYETMVVNTTDFNSSAHTFRYYCHMIIQKIALLRDIKVWLLCCFSFQLCYLFTSLFPSIPLIDQVVQPIVV